MTKSQVNKRNIIIPFLILICFVGLAILQQQSAKTKLNDNYVNGNLAGNLYNGGLFCESGDLIFFSNPKDYHKLYSMNKNGTDIKKLSDDTVSYINADAHYVYYVRDNTNNESYFSFLSFSRNSLCRINRDGGKVKILDSDPSLYASLVGNYIYYIHYDKENASTLYKVKIDGTEKQQVSKSPYFTCCTNNSYIYYNGLENDHYIYRFDTQTDSAVSIYEGNCWQPIVIGDTAYFMDANNNYALTKVDLNTGECTVISSDRIDCFNVYGSYIYFQRSDEANPAFCRITTEGTDYEEISTGVFSNINITEDYVYFYSYYDDTVCYRTPTFGSIEVSIFKP